ncbi:MAG: OsmC family peroxiredoxin [Chitinophagaceae bacterium]|nr:MAG: OsmC family peroxiredoxin [Chitinophagaceae bacterium]
MANHSIELQWMGNMQFNALVGNHTIILDAPERAGGKDAGPIPKPLLLTALAGCAGMEIMSMLRKEQIVLADFDTKVSGEVSRQQPFVYTSILIRFEVKGGDSNMQAVLDSIHRSQTEVCGVSAMLSKVLPIYWEISYNGRNVFSNIPSI